MAQGLTSAGLRRQHKASHSGRNLVERRILNFTAFLRNPGRIEVREALLGQGVLLWELWAIRLISGQLGEFPLRGCYVEQRKCRTSVVLRVLREGSFPTEPVTREAHPYLLPGVVMAERRNVGDEGEGVGEDPTQRMIERIWESLTEIRIQQMKSEQFRTLQQGNLSVLEYQMRFIALSRSRDSFKEVTVEAGNRVFSREVFSRAAATDRRFQKNHNRVRQGSLQHIQLLDVIIVGSQDI
ncbi:hypothetical protein Taro_026493 [Colocasia esculenta]|uniref:Retrotransposon gag domain-containing protein n=1 Tax=Colocasia esculenta TaxID=4460 RepID=A0A843VKS2_COLES|nr:hypothetical protein [Colocasia esculenta]